MATWSIKYNFNCNHTLCHHVNISLELIGFILKAFSDVCGVCRLRTAPHSLCMCCAIQARPWLAQSGAEESAMLAHAALVRCAKVEHLGAALCDNTSARPIGQPSSKTGNKTWRRKLSWRCPSFLNFIIPVWSPIGTSAKRPRYGKIFPAV